MAFNQSTVTLGATLLLCLAACMMLPGAKAAGRVFAAAKQAPTGCITVVRTCTRDDLVLSVAYRDVNTKTTTYEGYWDVPKGGSTEAICFGPKVDPKYGFYVHFNLKDAVIRYKSVVTLNDGTNTPDPGGSKEINGCALEEGYALRYETASFTTTFGGIDAVYKDLDNNKQGTCAELGGTQIVFAHVNLSAQNTLLVEC